VERLRAGTLDDALASGADRPAAGDRLRVLARLLAWHSLLSYGLGRAELADRLARQSLETSTRPELAGQDTRRERAFVLQQMGQLTAAHSPAEAQHWLKQSLALYQALDDRWGTANTLEGLGELAIGLADYDRAAQLCEEGLAIRRSLGDQTGIAESLTGLRMVAEQTGQFEENERLARECLAIHRETGDRPGIASGLHQLASALVVLGKFQQARPMLEESATISHDLGMRLACAMTNEILAWTEINLGLHGAAREHGHVALAILEEMDHQPGIAMTLLGLGELAVAQGAYTEAQRLLEQSASMYGEQGERHAEGLACAGRGLAALGLGQPALARGHLREALRAAAETLAWPTAVAALAGTALIVAGEGAPTRAVELYALASRYPYVGNSRFWEDVVGRHIAAATATLPQDVVAAARERGRARDLGATVAELLAELEQGTRDPDLPAGSLSRSSDQHG
jgi:tetratricopeptide (TPR) repeat protein